MAVAALSPPGEEGYILAIADIAKAIVNTFRKNEAGDFEAYPVHVVSEGKLSHGYMCAVLLYGRFWL